MNWAAFHLAAERALHGILQMEEFYRTEEWGQGVISKKKKKKGSFLGQDIFFQGHGEKQGLYHWNCLFFLWGMEWFHVTDYLTGADQKTSDWLIKILLLVKVETAIKLGIKSRFGILGFSTSDAIWGLWFLFLTAWNIYYITMDYELPTQCDWD